ncbi:serine/threonine protein kinase [Streptomyces chartreusis]|uniref:serine/threonine protein kinase n=1 Tax=Streptomyces chartreusis TaxID=1969 RepID=UPI003807CC05
MRNIRGREMTDWTVPGYVETGHLGSGATGRVVMAVELATSTCVAIKYLNPELIADQTFLDAFRVEADLLSELESPNVVRLYQYFEDGRGAAIIMELVDGPTLRTILRQEGALPPEAALAILKGSLLGLSYSHALDVIHRDYKPENVLITREGESKLADFGIAARGTTPHSAPGTPPYMAPEQWRGEACSFATDVYAATVTFFECLAGSRPFAGESIPELAVQHISAELPLERIPGQLRMLVAAGMAKDPLARPDSAGHFLTELEAVAVEACGDDWEDRGRRALAAAVLALLPLLPVPHTPPDAVTSLAETKLPSHSPGKRTSNKPRSARRIALAGTAIAGLTAIAVTVSGVTDHGGFPNTNGSSHVSPSSSEAPRDSADKHASAPSASLTPTSIVGTKADSAKSTKPKQRVRTPKPDETDRPIPDDGVNLPPTTQPDLPGQSAHASEPHPPSPSSEQPDSHPIIVRIAAVDISVDPERNEAVARVRITTISKSEVSANLSWYRSDTSGSLEVQDGDGNVRRLRGNTSYEFTVRHRFDSAECPLYWAVQLNTTPPASTERIQDEVLATSCPIAGNG